MKGPIMREIVTHARRQRVANYGDSQSVRGAERATIFTMRKEQGSALLLTVSCEEFSVPAAAIGTGDFRPMVHVDWGHGASSTETEVDVTFRQRFPVVASEIEVEAFIGSFPFPGQSTAPAVPSEASAKFRAFVGEGVDGLRLFATRHVTQINRSEGVLAEGQARLAGVRVFNPATAGAPEFFLLFDQETAPVAGDVPFDGAPVPLTNAVFGGLVPVPMGETRAFVRGIAWGMSSNPFAFAPTGTSVFVVGELEQ
jgi:hypothetical protein